MRFMVIVHPGDRQGYESGKMPSMELLENMGRFNAELVEKGVMMAGEGLHPSTNSTRVTFPGGGASPEVKQGPFADSLIGGFWIWNVKSKEEALEWARRAPMEDGATLEIRKLFEAEDFGPEIAAQENALKDKIAQNG